MLCDGFSFPATPPMTLRQSKFVLQRCSNLRGQRIELASRDLSMRLSTGITVGVGLASAANVSSFAFVPSGASGTQAVRVSGYVDVRRVT